MECLGTKQAQLINIYSIGFPGKVHAIKELIVCVAERVAESPAAPYKPSLCFGIPGSWNQSLPSSDAASAPLLDHMISYIQNFLVAFNSSFKCTNNTHPPSLPRFFSILKTIIL